MMRKISEQPDIEQPLLEIRGVSRVFAWRPVLRSLDLTIQAGERVALLGANGAGKTTLIRLLAGLLKPSKGKIILAGQDLQQDPQRGRSLVGLVAHHAYLYEELTAWENLLFFAQMYGVEQGKERAEMLLKQVGLQKLRNERVQTFSRGQLQRLAWARALLHRPRLLLLDEAETGLDQVGTRLMTELLDEHSEQQGAALLITHQLEHAFKLSQRFCILRQGRIVANYQAGDLSLEELRERYQELGGGA